MKKFGITIGIVLLLAGAIGISLFYVGKSVSKPSAEESLTYFINTVTEKVKTKTTNYETLGLADGVDGFSLLKTFPSLQPQDFTGVVAYQGEYSEKDGELVYTGNAASNSGVLLRAGMQTLFTNVTNRMQVQSTTKEDIDHLVMTLEMPEQATLTGTYIPCLPHQDNFSTTECTEGIKTSDGSYYAVNFSLMSQMHEPLKSGEKFTASGVLTPLQRMQSDQMKGSLGKGLFSVTNIVAEIKSSEEAVAFLKTKHPELKSYPSDNLPPKRIEVKDVGTGWQVGFYSEGSGLPGILAAKCYFINTYGDERSTGEFSAGGKAGPATLDLSTCTAQ